MEIWRILSKLTIKKIFNLILLKISYLSWILFKNSRIKGLPFGLSIEPTTACNLHCAECPSGLNLLKRPKGNILLSDFYKIIDELSPYLMSLILYFQGEPFLHKNLFELITYASNKKIYTITSTNGHFLTKENCEKIIETRLDKLIISLDGTNQEVYSQYRIGGDFQTVINGIKQLILIKEKLKSRIPFVELQFLVTRNNEHQINEIKQLAKELKVDKLSLKTAQIYDYKNGNSLIPKLRKYSRYKKNRNGSYSIKNTMQNRCKRAWTTSVITWNGDVLPCCFDKDADFKMGNLKEKSFKEIWHSLKYQSFRKKIRNNRKSIEMCKNCTEGMKI